MSLHCRYLPIFPVPEKFQEKYIRNQCSRRLRRPEGESEGAHPPPRRPSGQKPPKITRITKFSSVPSPPRSRDRDRQKTSARHPARGRIDLRELLHHH